MVGEEGEGRAQVAIAGRGQERLEQGSSHHQEVAKDGLFHLMDRLVLIGGGVEAFHEGPEDREGLIDGGLFRAARRRELDGGGDGGEHERGSSPMRDILGRCKHPGMYREERAISRSAPS
jgi:hypothetical protein